MCASPVVEVPVVPTPDDVKAFWTYMQRKYRFRTVRKQDAAEMKFVAEVLDLMKITNKEAFLERFTTVIPLSSFRGVYIPFELGVSGPHYDLWGQMVVCVHECDHIAQCDKEGDLGYAWKYLTSAADRAHYEAGGYRCNLEMNWRYQRRVLKPADLAANLVHYGCSRVDVETTRKQLALCLPAIRQGAIVEPAMRTAVIWLDNRYGKR